MKEIVIELNDTTYESLTSPSVVVELATIRNLVDAVLHGKVLPKGHGRIVDINEAIDVLIEEWGYEGIEDDMYRVTTLVEADTEE